MTCKRLRLIVLLLLMTSSSFSSAEQKQHLGPFDVHYVVVPSTFFSAEISERYNIVRGPDRALMNLSILDDKQVAQPVELKGEMINLLGQRQQLQFREIREGSAIYYLAPIKHSDRETLRFEVEITGNDGVVRKLTFQQQMFWDGR